MPVYRVEAELTREGIFFVEADTKAEAHEAAGELAREAIQDAGEELETYEREVNPERYAEQIRDYGIWRGGPKGSWD